MCDFTVRCCQFIVSQNEREKLLTPPLQYISKRLPVVSLVLYEGRYTLYGSK